MVNFKKMRAMLNKVNKNSFLIGIGSILNIYPVYGNANGKATCHPDTHILKSDWKVIGNDFNNAMKKIKK
jgi:NAD-dependent SIR2 family protein deacetylase